MTKRWVKFFFDSSMGLTHSNSLLIFQKMNLFLKIYWICCFFFVLQVAKKDGCFYPPTKYVVFPFLKFHIIIYFCKYVLNIGFFLNVLNRRPIQKPFIWVLVKILIIFWLWSGCFSRQSRRVFLYIKHEFDFFWFFFLGHFFSI